MDLAFPDRASLDSMIGVLWVQELNHHRGLLFAYSWSNQPSYMADTRVFPPCMLILR